MNRFNFHTENPVIVLIRPPVSRWDLYKWYAPFGSHEPALGLLYIASYLDSGGFKVFILDGEIIRKKEIWARLFNLKPDIVGITSTSFSFNSASEISNQIRSSFEDTLILLGGSHASAVPEESLQMIPSLDGVIYGEGEETFLEIARQTRTNNINGLVWRDDNGKIVRNVAREPNNNLDNYQLNWKLLERFPAKYAPPFQSKKKNSASLVVSRGCVYRCSFCASKAIWGNKVRFHSPEFVVNIMSGLAKEYGITDFYFHDDYLPAKLSWINSFCDILLQQKRLFTWSCASRLEILNSDLLGKMKLAGCLQIGVGIESGSPTILDILNKKLTIYGAAEGIKRIVSAGIKVKGYFILDSPGETLTDLFKTLKFIIKNKLSALQFNYYAPLPGSMDFLKYRPPAGQWQEMSLQKCFGYSGKSIRLYIIIELGFYFIAYTKIFFAKISDALFNSRPKLSS